MTTLHHSVEPLPSSGLSAWLPPLSVRQLLRRGLQTPARLAGALPVADWPGLDRLAAWMRADRLRCAEARLWRAACGRHAAAIPVDPRSWTHERRLGDQVMRGLLHAEGVQRELAQGGWLQLGHLQRVDAGLAEAVAAAQAALGMPLRAQGWRGQAPFSPQARDPQCPSAGRPVRLAGGKDAQLDLAPAEVPASRWFLVLDGEMSLSWPEASGVLRRLSAQAGDLLYLPPESTPLRLRTATSVWAIELQAEPLTVLDLLRDLGDAALTTLRDESALRRCPGTLPDDTGPGGDLQRLVQALRAQPLPNVVTAGEHHLAQRRQDADRLPIPGRLTALSRLWGADDRTPLVGRPDRVLSRELTPQRLTLRVAHKEFHFDPRAAALLDFLLQDRPYRLVDAPGRHPLGERLQLTRQLAVEGLVGPAFGLVPDEPGSRSLCVAVTTGLKAAAAAAESVPPEAGGWTSAPAAQRDGH